MNASELLAGLNSEQLAAVTWPAAPALVLAGAGSGKTRVLTTRIAWLLQCGQADVRSVLAVTFTNKAAKEMQLRLSAMLPVSVRAMWLGTFHGLCHRFLRLHYRAAGLPQTFQILDSADQLAAIKRLLKNLNIAEEVIAPRALQGFINAQKEAGLRAGTLNAPDPYTRRLIDCYAAYDAQCQSEGVVDFAELMLRSFEVLQNDEALRRHYQSRFNHILVDEFQDTNKLQYAWLKLLTGEHTAVFAVGDDDQSIYRFRGAHVGNMAQFLKDFGVEAPLKLEQNYRSDAHILTAANAVIAHNAERLGKNLRTEAGAGEKIRFLVAHNDLDEAEFVLEEVRSLAREQDWALDDMAVLYRSNAQSRVLEQVLFRAGLPYRIYGGLRFYERQEIKHALAYLRLTVHPDDDNALLRIINFPPRGIGARSIEQLQAQAAVSGSLWEAARVLAGKNSKIAAFVALMAQLRAAVPFTDLPELLGLINRDSGLLDHYRHAKGQHQDRIDNLEELVHAAIGFDPTYSLFETPEPAPEPNSPIPVETPAEAPAFRQPENPASEAARKVAVIQSFLANAALEAGEHQAAQGEAALQLMTVHAAKGLEFNAVFLTGMEEGLFPSEYSLAEQGGLEEERRLMYVAITRARKRLFISMARERLLHGRTHFGIVSRFVKEIPPEVLHPLSGSLNSNTVLRQQLAERPNPMHSRSPGAVEERRDLGGFALGENVRHPKFGTGVIIDGVSKGESARLSINFGKHGIKELDTAFAKLEKV